ncbi:gastrula zinc finger protein XlCGF26.1 isoform X17 [Amyelois transitella]|uniref:gastrula zinc finger protein XlCGF26.1 isoform X17 n=1 Tax=Amyelois transitella TaxID=680683 RepID=UPI00067B6FAB|nr:gastrula zinc finger protein XlCGF26.1 isoform X17 [Amyelois transitella]
MAAKSEWRPGPTVCRCCLTEGCYKDISTEYFWMGKREVYAEMLKDTLEVTIAYSKAGGPNSNSRLICESCISRLRDATEFKRQVVECERMFMQHLDPGSSSAAIEAETEPVGKIKVEGVKLEKSNSDDDFDNRHAFGDDDDDDDDDLDNQPLTKLASKMPTKESVDLLDLLDNSKTAEKRKSSTKVKPPPPKKAKSKVEQVKVKPSGSKLTPKPEKKKKEPVKHAIAIRNAEIVLRYMTVHPFRLSGHHMVCVYCWEEFADPADYRQHMHQNHENFTVSTAFAHCGYRRDCLKADCTEIKCRKCGQEFEDLDSAAKHIYESHDRKMNLSHVIGLQPYRLSTDNWTCYLCSTKLPSITKLCRHTATHFLQHTCDVCGRSYLTKEALKYHVKCSHSGKQQCRKCWAEFDTLEKRREHQRESKKCWAFCCVNCGERFISWEAKRQHLNEVHQVPQRTYPCPECGAVYVIRKQFYRHFKLVHTNESFVCSCCGLKFVSKNQLEDHRVVHTGEKQHICIVCAKTFSREKSLKQHMWIHSEIKRFSCNVCDKQFAQKISLKGHMKSHHPDVSVEF